MNPDDILDRFSDLIDALDGREIPDDIVLMEAFRDEFKRQRENLAELQVVTAECLTNVAQVFDGWHADGTAWTEWDEAVRHSVGRILAVLAAGGRDESSR